MTKITTTKPTYELVLKRVIKPTKEVYAVTPIPDIESTNHVWLGIRDAVLAAEFLDPDARLGGLEHRDDLFLTVRFTTSYRFHLPIATFSPRKRRLSIPVRKGIVSSLLKKKTALEATSSYDHREAKCSVQGLDDIEMSKTDQGAAVSSRGTLRP